MQVLGKRLADCPLAQNLNKELPSDGFSDSREALQVCCLNRGMYETWECLNQLCHARPNHAPHVQVLDNRRGIVLFDCFGGICRTSGAARRTDFGRLGGAAAGPFYPAIVSALRGSVNRDPSKQYSIYVEHLDFNRFRGPEYELGLKTFFTTKYKDHPLGVIVAIGIGALQYVLRSREEIWPGVPIVFTFVDPQLLSALPADVTGTTFRLKLSDMIAAARVVVPDLDRIAVVGDPLNTLVPYRAHAGRDTRRDCNRPADH